MACMHPGPLPLPQRPRQLHLSGRVVRPHRRHLDRPTAPAPPRLPRSVDGGGAYSWTPTNGGRVPGGNYSRGAVHLAGAGALYGEFYSWRYRLPAGLGCTRCVLQVGWQWESCELDLPGYSSWVFVWVQRWRGPCTPARRCVQLCTSAPWRPLQPGGRSVPLEAELEGQEIVPARHPVKWAPFQTVALGPPCPPTPPPHPHPTPSHVADGEGGHHDACIWDGDKNMLAPVPTPSPHLDAAGSLDQRLPATPAHAQSAISLSVPSRRVYGGASEPSTVLSRRPRRERCPHQCRKPGR